MAFQEKRLGYGQLASGSQTTLYTVPAATTGIVKTIIITNTTATDATVELWHVDSGGSVGDTNKILDDFTVPANDFMQISTFAPMATGDTLQAESSVATTLCVNVYGAEVS